MKIMKVLSVLTLIVMLVSMGTPVFAATTLTPGTLKPGAGGTAGTQIQKAGQNIMGIIQVVGIVISVVILMVIGIKYMMGSAEEKAEYKKTMIPYIVGAVLIFAATTISNIVFQFAGEMLK